MFAPVMQIFQRLQSEEGYTGGRGIFSTSTPPPGIGGAASWLGRGGEAAQMPAGKDGGRFGIAGAGGAAHGSPCLPPKFCRPTRAISR